MIERALLMFLFLLGFFGLIARRNLVKKVYALAIQNTAVVLLFVLEGSRIGEDAPLLGDEAAVTGSVFVDPLPQALMLTAIVVGVCVSALALALVYRLHKLYGTLDSDDLRRIMGHE